MSHTAHENLTHIATEWPTLRALLEARTPRTWPPAARMADHQRNLDLEDDDETTATLATLERAERTAVAPGERPAPLRVPILDVITELEDELLALADEIAGSIQRPAFTAKIRAASPLDDVARSLALMGMKDAADERRWRFNMADRDGAKASAWLADRLAAAGGPFQPLSDTQRCRIAATAASVRRRLDRALGEHDQGATTLNVPCPCGSGPLTWTPGENDFTLTCETCGFYETGSRLLNGLNAA